MSKELHQLLDVAKASQEAHSRGEQTTSVVVCTYGEPGIGKTHGVKEWAKSIGYVLETIILGRIPSVDVGGIFAPDFEKEELKHFVTTKLIGGNIPDDADGIVVFLDELASAQEDTQVAVQAIIEDRYLEGRHVPDNVIFVCATNLPEHTGGANDLVDSLKSRLLFYEHKFDHDEWLLRARTDWAVEPEIYQYHGWSEGAKLHNFQAHSDALSQADPRGWMKVDNAFKGLKQTLGCDTVYEIFAKHRDVAVLAMDGLIGKGASADFWGFIECNGEIPSVRQVINDPKGCPAPKPTQPNHQHAIIYNLTYYVSQRAEDDKLTKKDVEACLAYLRRMSRPMAALGFRLMSDVKQFCERTNKYVEFRKDYADVVEV